jgi:serine/threonine-protein kinase
MWSSTFDGQPSELAGIQDTIMRAITGRLRLRDASAHSDQTAAGGARGTTNVEAYYDFLRGRHAFDRFEFARAQEALRSAIARDPRFARAHAMLAMAYANAPTLGLASVDSMNALARASAERALALDSTVVEAYLAECYIVTSEFRLAEAVKPAERAMQIDSTNAEVLFTYAGALSFMGRNSEAVTYARRAQERDPLSQTAVGLFGYILAMDGQRDEGLAMEKAARDLDTTNVIMHQGVGFMFSFSGMPDSALAEFETAFRLNPALFGGRSNLVFGYAVAGRWSDVARQRALLERDPGGNSPHYPLMVANLVYGDYDAAMTALERGVAAKESLFGVLSLPCDPLLNPLKSSPRFTALMQRLGARTCPATVKWPIAARPH